MPAFLLTETFRRSFAARIASQSPGALGPFSPPNRRSVQQTFIFPVAGSNRSGRTIDQRLYFLNTRAVRSLLLKEGLQVFHLGRASDIDTERGEDPQGGIRPLFIHRGGEDGGRLVDVRQLEHHEERHEPHGQGKEDDLPSILSQDGEIFPEVDFVFLVPPGEVLPSPFLRSGSSCRRFPWSFIDTDTRPKARWTCCSRRGRARPPRSRTDRKRPSPRRVRSP